MGESSIETHRHVFRSADDRTKALHFLQPASDAGLAPEILDWGPNEAVAALRPFVLKLINGIHRLGICHRDLHVLNLLMIDGVRRPSRSGTLRRYGHDRVPPPVSGQRAPTPG